MPRTRAQQQQEDEQVERAIQESLALVEEANDVVNRTLRIIDDREVVENLHEIQDLLQRMYETFEGNFEEEASEFTDDQFLEMLREAKARAPNAQRIEEYFFERQ